jgi:hypothetical protein
MRRMALLLVAVATMAPGRFRLMRKGHSTLPWRPGALFFSSPAALEYQR